MFSTCDLWGIFLPPVLYGGYRQVKKTQKASEPCELLADEEPKIQWMKSWTGLGDSYMFQQRPNPKGLTSIRTPISSSSASTLILWNLHAKIHPKKSSKSKQPKKDRIQVFFKIFCSNRISLLSFKIINMFCAGINFLYLFFSLLRFFIFPKKTSRHGKVMQNPISIQAARAPWSDAHRCRASMDRMVGETRGGCAFV